MYSLKNKELGGISITSVRNKNNPKSKLAWAFLQYIGSKTREAKNGENTPTQIQNSQRFSMV